VVEAYVLHGSRKEQRESRFPWSIESMRCDMSSQPALPLMSRGLRDPCVKSTALLPGPNSNCCNCNSNSGAGTCRLGKRAEILAIDRAMTGKAALKVFRNMLTPLAKRLGAYGTWAGTWTGTGPSASAGQLSITAHLQSGPCLPISPVASLEGWQTPLAIGWAVAIKHLYRTGAALSTSTIRIVPLWGQ
jgi:hypothetical protein